MMTRRVLLKGFILAGSGLILGCLDPSGRSEDARFFPDNIHIYGNLDPSARTFLAVIAAVMLAEIKTLSRDETEQLLITIDKTLDFMPSHSRSKIGLLFDSLNSFVSRVYLTGIWGRWETASDKQVSQFLNKWKDGDADRYRIGYRSLHDLIYGAHYAVSLYPQSP